MNLDATQSLLLIILAFCFRDGLLAWFLIGKVIHVPAPAPVPHPVPVPVPPGPIPPPGPEPVPKPDPTKADNSTKCIALTLQWEGGNDDDPRDPGGRTSRGILQREWNLWRNTHPGLPADVWQAPQDQVVAIYKKEYWEVLQCDKLPLGVDYAVYDYGVNSGVSRSAKALQAILGVKIDGVIGPETIAAISPLKGPSLALINQICDERLHFLQRLGTWGTFGGGWSRRVAGVRKEASAMVQ